MPGIAPGLFYLASTVVGFLNSFNCSSVVGALAPAKIRDGELTSTRY